MVPRSLSDLWGRLRGGLRAFGRRRAFLHALSRASTERDPARRVALAELAARQMDKLEPWPFADLPRDRAAGILHGIRGQAFFDLRPLDRRYYADRAIEEMEAGARLLTPGDGSLLGQLLSILSIAYAEYPSGRPAENLDRAVATAEAALASLDPVRDGVHWADAAGYLASYLSSREHGERRVDLERSIELLQRARSMVSKARDPLTWARITANLANAYRDRLDGNPAENLETAIALTVEAAPMLLRAGARLDWAGSMMNLASCYHDRIRGRGVENTEEAIRLVDTALDVFDRHCTPEKWASAQMNRATYFADRRTGDPATNVETAIQGIENALLIYTADEYPIEHAKALLNLSQLRSGQRVFPKRLHTEPAVDAAREAIAAVSRDGAPAVWGLAMIALGNALFHRRGGARKDDLEEAISAFEAARSVFDRDAHPGPWEVATTNLSSALAERIEGDRIENLERAIGLQHEALEVIDPRARPRDWAGAMRNLAISYGDRQVGSRADNVERALALAEAGLVAVRGSEYPMERSQLLEVIGTGLSRRVRGDRRENLDHALQVFGGAARDRERGADQEAWLRLQQKHIATFLKLPGDGRVRTESRRGSPPSDPDSEPFDRDAFCARLQEAASQESRDDDPGIWLAVQRNLAGAHLLFARIDAVTDELVRAVWHAIESVAVCERLLSVAPRDAEPGEWAATRWDMASAYALLHMVEDLRHRGIKGLADRARPDLPNPSPTAMRYLDLAIEALGDVLAVHTMEASPRSRLRAAVDLGQYKIWRRDWSGAESAYAIAAEAAERVLGDVEVSDGEFTAVLRAFGDLATLGPFSALMVGNPDRALDLLEAGHARLLAKALTLATLPLPPEERGELQALLRQVAEQERRLVSPTLIDRATPLDESIRLRAIIRERVSQLWVETDRPGRETQSLLAGLAEGSGATIVIPLLSEVGGRILVVDARDGETRFHTSEAGDRTQLGEIVGYRISEDHPGWHHARQAFVGISDPDDWSPVLDALGATLGAVLAGPIVHALDVAQLPDGARIDVLPQGEIGVLPLNLARHPQSSALLIEHFELSHTPSLTTLARARQRTRGAGWPASAAVVADPTLPGAALEAELAASWFDEASRDLVWVRGDTRDHVLEALARREIWHFACHANFDAQAPLQSGLDLTGSERLTLQELIDARGLGAPRLVILSACESGLYDTRELQSEFIGLPTAFLQLGAAAVVATLWIVPDDAAALLIGRFYDEYLGAGKTSSAALRAAQRWLRDAGPVTLRRAVEGWTAAGRVPPGLATVPGPWLARNGSAPPYASPSYWGAFVHYGA